MPGVSIMNQISLSQLGWRHFFQLQLSLSELEQATIARVIGVERSECHALSEQGVLRVLTQATMPPLVVGDWILIGQDGEFQRLLERFSLFQRKAAGTRVDTQLIAANLDTLFVVCSMNKDFNLSRIERYLAMANEAGVEAVVVLSKADCCDDPEHYVEQLTAIDSMLMVVAINGCDPVSVQQLQPWCCGGKTVALLGSSGVGKSTLINTLSGGTIQSTSAIRTDDDKGRHTTTSRSLHLLAGGGLVLDTPGMRELQLSSCEQGVDETFSEITRLAAECRFSDCQHQSEPGCAVRAAIDAGVLSQRRLNNYIKLKREQAFNAATLAEKRAKQRQFGKHVRSVMGVKNKLKGR